MANIDKIPLFYNPDSGTSQSIITKLQNDERLHLEAVRPEELGKKIDTAVKYGEKRILVSGGDGTLALAASRLAGKKAVLGVIPSGTLNHFAQRIGIPNDVNQFVDIAVNGKPMPVDVAYVNDKLFINTSSVGAYTVFVRSRKQLQKRMPYSVASLIAGFRRLLNFRKVRVHLQGKELHTPLVFLGVAERDLQVPFVGQVKKEGQRKLHLIALDCDSRVEIVKIAIKSILFGLDPLSRECSLKNELVEKVELRFRRKPSTLQIALDGELLRLSPPLRYRLAKEEILVAMPS